MSERRSGSESDNSQEESAEDKPPYQVFQFIDLSNSDPGLRKQNRTKARSHVMKNVRRRRREEDEKQRQFVIQSSAELATVLKDMYSQNLFTSMNQNLLAYASSPWSRIEAEIMPTLVSQWKWSPIAHQLVHHMVTVELPTLFPTSSVYKPSAAALEAWHAIRSSSMLIHAIIWGAAVHRDSQRRIQEQSNSLEVLAHRGEAVSLISNELSNVCKGNEPSDALLFSVLCTTVELGDLSPAIHINKPSAHPFRLSQLPQGWEQSFVSVRYSQVHSDGLFALVARRGGLAALQNRSIAKMISDLDVLIAAQELRAPTQAYVEVDEIASLAANLSLNVPEPELYENRAPGCSLPALQRLVGTSSPLALVLDRLQRLFTRSNALARGMLRNVNVLALGKEQGALHHAVLSVPSHPSGADSSLYEPVRLVTLIFDVGILFPLPPSTGVLGRIVVWMKVALQDISVEQIHDEMVEALIWILFVSGVAAKEMPERAWFVERLSGLVERQGITRWVEVKNLLRSFVWMADAMDDEAIDLWDDVRRCRIAGTAKSIR